MNIDSQKQLIGKNTSYFLRGIAMIMVVLSHYFEWGETAITNKGLVAFMSALGDPGVGIFFFLSGYALYKGYPNGMNGQAKKYIISRLKGVYIPYLLIAGVIRLLDNGFTDFKSVIYYLTGRDYWFMAVIFAIYIAFLLVGMLPKWRLFIMTVLIIDLSLWLYISGHEVFWYDANWCFALGMLISKYDSSWGFVNRGFSINIKDYVFKFIGTISLYIYILHTYVYRIFMTTLSEKGVELSWYLRASVAFLITVGIGWIVYFALNILFRFVWNVLNKS